jgi:hypothetical protein
MNSIGKKVTTIRHWWLLVVMQALLVAPLVASAADGYCSICSCNGDRDGNGTVTVDEVVTAVNYLLEGCPPLLWQHGCGPIFGGGMDECPETSIRCSDEKVGDGCGDAHVECCPPGSKCSGTWCNEPLVCATEPPRFCPISRRAFKRDVEYLDRGDIDALRHQLLAFKLARYRYKADAQSTPAHLGFIIDDIEPSPAVDASGNAVDLYGYLSMAVATVQAQSKDIDVLKQEVDDLRGQLNGLKAVSARPSRHAAKPRGAQQETILPR